ncbi:MAG TPA: NlpC/P60 family protein [Gaiellaceae bacterium]|nr:NlpC/P60 family protein [Gaiellaceae bacterium]
MRRSQVAVIPVSIVAALAVAGSATAEPSSVSSKRAQAQSVMAQIQALDANLEHAVDAYNLANERLNAIKGDLAENRVNLQIAASNLRAAQRTLASRMVAIYTSDQNDSTLDVLVGSRSLTDLLDGLETVSRISDQDAQVLNDVTRFRLQMRRARARLRRDRDRQAELVAERAAHKASIESQLSERQQMLSSIKSEIAAMQAAERRRQAQLAAQARARLAAPQPLIPQLSASQPAADATAPETALPPPPPAKFGGVVGIAMQYLGVPYVYGGASPSGFDCSGFIMYVFAQVGVSLPHNAAAQYGYGTPVDRSQLQPGDLVFFNGLGHAGIYIGGGSFIHAPHTGDVVKISTLSGWYSSTWVGARRL